MYVINEKPLFFKFSQTAVVTTTLNGKRQTLKMDEGNQGQVACLANADAWVPKAKSDTDEQSLASFFQSREVGHYVFSLTFLQNKLKWSLKVIHGKNNKCREFMIMVRGGGDILIE